MQSKTPAIKNSPAFSAFTILRISVGIVYFWFGALKFFQGLSPAEQLAMQTIHKITFGLINDRLNIIMLASWECLVGVLLIIGKWIKPALMLLFLHMVCTFSPFIFFPDQGISYCPLRFITYRSVHRKEYYNNCSRTCIVENRNTKSNSF